RAPSGTHLRPQAGLAALPQRGALGAALSHAGEILGAHAGLRARALAGTGGEERRVGAVSRDAAEAGVEPVDRVGELAVAVGAARAALALRRPRHRRPGVPAAGPP